MMTATLLPAPTVRESKQGTRWWDRVRLPIGPKGIDVLLTSDGEALTGLRFGPADPGTTDEGGRWVHDPAPLAGTSAQLAAYAEGDLVEFDLPLRPSGTGFQREVWARLLAIPYGTTTSYGRIAAEIGRPRASRAVGAAVGSNPIGIVIPCHRVIGSDGALTGFAGGLDNKVALLRLEGVSAL